MPIFDVSYKVRPGGVHSVGWHWQTVRGIERPTEVEALEAAIQSLILSGHQIDGQEWILSKREEAGDGINA